MKRFFMYGISKSLLIKIILALLILLGVKDVFAAEFNMNNYTSATKTSSKGQYGGTEFTYGGIPGQRWNFGTRYDGRLNDIITYFDYPFEKNTTYRFTYNMATNDFNNNFASSYWWDCDDSDPVAHVFIPTYISYKKVQYSITPSENTTCIKVQLYAKNNGGGVTQIKNWNLSSITLYDPDYQSGSGSGQGTSPAPTPNPNQDIINNQNDNTQDIINNQNENTNDIITSIQETTSQVSETIENTFTNKCTNLLDLNDYDYKNDDLELIVHNGILELHSENAWSHVVYKIPIDRNKTYYFKGNFISLYPNHSFLSMSFNGNDIIGERFWNYEPYQAIGGIQNGLWETSFNSGNNDFVYLGIWVNKGEGGNSGTYLNMMFDEYNLNFCPFGTTQSNKIDELNSKLDGIQNAINDDSLPEVDIDLEYASDTPISDLLLLPINFLNKAQDSLNTSCSNYVLPFDFFGGNNTITLPCIDLKDYLGNDVTNLIDAILCFYFAYEIAMLCVSIYNNVTSLDDGFNALYEPKHGAPDGASSYIGRHGGGAR